jgi:mRNA-degrading endonuclease toxin of MazEF toxin-antitoxin module
MLRCITISNPARNCNNNNCTDCNCDSDAKLESAAAAAADEDTAVEAEAEAASTVVLRAILTVSAKRRTNFSAKAQSLTMVNCGNRIHS